MCKCCKLVWIFAAAICLSAAQSPAADRTWTGSAGTDFTNGGSWNPSGVLLDTDDYYINIADANAPVLTTAYPGVTIGKLRIGDNSTSSGKLTIQGGVLSANGEVAIGDGGTGIITLADISSTLNSATKVIIGNNGGTGTLSTFGSLNVAEMMVGSYANSQGVLDIKGGTVAKTGGLCVGFDGGLGAITMAPGSYLTSTGGAIEIGRYTLNDNKWSMDFAMVDHSAAADIVIGTFGGKGTLDLKNSSSFTQSSGSLYIGHINYYGRANGYLNISDYSAYNFTNGSGSVYVGNFDCDGTINITGGSMTLSSGASLKVGTSTEAAYAGSKGVINMNGGTLTNAGITYIGSGWGNEGTLDMSNGATYTHGNSSDCMIGDNVGTGTLKMVGSAEGVEPAVITTFNCPKALRLGNGGMGTIEMNQNSVLNAGSYLVIGGGNSSSAVGNLTMTGNAKIVKTGSNSMFVGENLATGHATMSGTSGITTSTADLEVGKRGGVGDLTMNGNSSITLTGRTLYVGYGGTGTVTTNDSSVLSTSSLRVGQSLGGSTEYAGNGTFNMNGGTITTSATITVGIAATIGKNFADATLTPETKTIGKMFVDGGTFGSSIAHFVDGGTLGLNTADNDATSGSNHNGLFKMSTGSITTSASSGVVVGGTLGIQTKNLNTTTGSNNVGSFEMTGGTFNVGTTSTIVIGSTYKTRSGSVVNGTGNQGTFHLDGGTFNIGTPGANSDTSTLWLGYGAGNTADITIDSGNFDASGIGLTVSAANFGVGGTFTWTQNGGHTILPRVNTGSSNAVTTYNLNGGVFEVSQLRPVSATTGVNGLSTTFNFDGGTIKAREITGQFIWSRGDTASYAGNVFTINVKPGNMIVDPNGIMGLGGNYGIIIPTPLTSVGTTGKLIVRDSTAGNQGNLTLYGNSSAFVGNIDVEEGSLVGRGVNAFGFGDAARTIKVNATGKLGFRSSNTSTMYAGDFASTTVPTIDVDGGTLFVDPYITFTGNSPETWVRTFFPTRATVNNVTLKNAVMTSSSEDVIGTGTTTYAWNINGVITSEGNSTIDYTASQNPACPNTGLIALQSGDMANPKTTFDVQNGTLTVASPLTDGLSVAGTPRATGLTKTGSGTMTIAGNLTYTGNTDIQSGVFQIASTSPITLTTVTGTGTLEVLAGSTLTAASIQVDTLSIGSAHTAAVPEPCTIVLLLLAGAIGAAAIVRRK